MVNVRRIGVVTVTYNSGEVLHEFLDCVIRQTFRDFILYVIDNASKDKSVEIALATQDPRLRVIRNADNLGVAEGNNEGIRAARADGCEAVLLLNNDTVFPEDLFAELHAGLSRYKCDMTTGTIYYYDPPDVIWSAGGHFNATRLFGVFHDGKDEKDAAQYSEPRRVTYTPTCCLLIRCTVFDRIGLMDINYFVYADDVDFLYRCLQNNLSLWYVPQAKLWHKISSLTGGDNSDFAIRYMTRNRMYFLRKHRPAWQAWMWRFHFMVYTAPLRLLLRRDSLATWKLRCASIREGWTMAGSL